MGMDPRADGSSSGQKRVRLPLTLFVEAHGLEVEQELFTLAAQYWAEGIWKGKWYHEQREAWMKQIQEVQSWKQVRGPAGAVMCETRDLGIKCRIGTPWYLKAKSELT